MSLSRFKLAGSPEDSVEDEEPRKSHTARNLAMLGATALPFAGLIGEKPLLHDGGGTEFGSLDELGKNLSPGDVVLSSPHKKTFTNLGIGLGTGVPDVSHAAFVDDMGRLVTTRDVEKNPGPMVDKLERGRAYTVLRPRDGGILNPAELAKRYRRQLDLADSMVASAKSRGASPAEIHDLRRDFYTKTPGFIRTPLHSVMAPTLGSVAGDSVKKTFEDFLVSPTREGIHDCAGGWCSLPGALAFPKGTDVVHGRAPRDITPVDYLRSPHLEAVGGFGRGKNRLVDRMIRAGPTAARLTYGAIGAGSIYAADKAVDAVKAHLRKRQEEKELSDGNRL